MVKFQVSKDFLYIIIVMAFLTGFSLFNLTKMKNMQNKPQIKATFQIHIFIWFLIILFLVINSQL
ncbi:MAG: hypothetical protein N4A54_13145 [Peptostreptococcaceae bacterium]|jgi:hypothetical protein|nr:hypothetical protein [Peptostreptococcaceae bacterium]